MHSSALVCRKGRDGVATFISAGSTPQDISAVVWDFAEAARRAQSACFDGVQIHAAHGFLLSQFLSPFYNRRQDQYGGEIENRARFLLEVYRAVRASVGKDYAVLVKINCQDFIENGLTLEDSASRQGCWSKRELMRSS